MSDAAVEPTTAPESSQADEQEQSPTTFDAAYVANLRKEAAKYRTEARANADAAKRLAELEQANLSEVEKAKKEAADAAARLREYEIANMRQSVALHKGLNADLAERLRGDTLEELEQDADALLALFNAPRSPQPDYSQGAQQAAPTTPEQEFVAFTSKL